MYAITAQPVSACARLNGRISRRTFGRERTARDAVAGDPVPAEAAGEVAAQVVQRRLRRRVRERLVRGHTQALHRADLRRAPRPSAPTSRAQSSTDGAHVDDPRRVPERAAVPPALRGGSAEEREAELGEREHALDVQREDLRPRRVRVVVDARAPRRACVVDEDVQRGLARGELLREPLRLGELLQVCGQRDARARRERVQLRGGRVAVLHGARGDVDLGAVLDETGRNLGCVGRPWKTGTQGSKNRPFCQHRGCRR